jgi:Skp family chaperone for outer membrane proteins
MNRTTRSTILFIAAVFLGSMTVSAIADVEHFDKTHPRRAEVNHRLKHQNKRIHKEVKEGEMSKEDAAKLHKEDRNIRKEERLMASQNGGHITKQEKKALNQQENAVSKEIGK